MAYTLINATYFTFDSGHTSSTMINDELKKISRWLAANKLSLNVRKNKYMGFHTARKLIDYPVLQIDNFTIERIQKFKFLGLHIINNNLTWDTQQNHISLKISKITVNRLKYIYPQHILHMLYNTLILPHLNYSLIVWGFDLSRILLLQKRAMRTITNSWYRTHTTPMFKSLNILKINYLYWLMVPKFYYKLGNK